MSDLHLSLIAIGLLVIAGVVIYNWLQERKFRKLAQARFQTPQEDVLMSRQTAQEDVDTPTTISRETLDDVRIEPRMGEEASGTDLSAPTSVEPAQVAENLSDLENVSPTSRATDPIDVPPPIDVAIDFVVKLNCADPVMASAAQETLLPADSGKRAFWLGLTPTGHWEPLESARPHLEFTLLCGAMQLADRAGAVTEDELDQFIERAQQAAEKLMAVTQIPTPHTALKRAAQLDEFCADVDILVGVNVVALEQDTFPGTKIRALAEAAGFKLLEDGTYQYVDDHGNALYALTNQESTPFKPQEMKYLNTHGLTLLFDVPRVPNGLRAFDHMVLFARQLTDSLKGMLVDDNLRPLTEEGLGKIRQQLSLIYGKMDKHGIPAGSMRAQRLFS